MLILSFATAACAHASPAIPAPAEHKLTVGIVLPTKDEPRRVQDKNRFKDSLSVGYDLEILLSQVDSALEKTNVESLITISVKVIIICPQDGNARAITDTFGADKDISSHLVTGQDAKNAPFQFVIDSKQRMTVFKDLRTLVAEAITAAVALVMDEPTASKGSYNNGKINVPSIQSEVVTVDKANVKSALIDQGTILQLISLVYRNS